MSREFLDFNANKVENQNIDILTIHTLSNETLVLLRKKRQPIESQVINMSRSTENCDWMDPLKKAVSKDQHVILYAENDSFNGIIGFLNCLRKEPGGENVICVFTQDNSAPPFSAEDEFYKEIIKKRLTFNIYKDGMWGTYRHVKLQKTSHTVCDNCFAGFTGRGDLSSLSWIQGPSQQQSERDHDFELINVSCTKITAST